MTDFPHRSCLNNDQLMSIFFFHTTGSKPATCHLPHDRLQYRWGRDAGASVPTVCRAMLPLQLRGDAELLARLPPRAPLLRGAAPPAGRAAAGRLRRGLPPARARARRGAARAEPLRLPDDDHEVCILTQRLATHLRHLPDVYEHQPRYVTGYFEHWHRS